jgi:hypothetical protein
MPSSGLPLLSAYYLGTDRYPVIELTGQMTRHPTNPAWSASPVLGQGELIVTTPYGQAERCRLAEMPYEEWFRVRDQHQLPAPLEVYIGHTGVKVCWLPWFLPCPRLIARHRIAGPRHRTEGPSQNRAPAGANGPSRGVRSRHLRVDAVP